MEKIHDSETRIRGIHHLAELINLSNEDLTLLMFLVMGDPADNASLKDVLQRVKLPRVNAKYSSERLRYLCSLLADRMKDLDSYGVLNMQLDKVEKMSLNGEYMSLYGMDIMPLIYVNTWKMLSYKQDYVITTLLGLKEALDILLNFLDVSPVEQE